MTPDSHRYPITTRSLDDVIAYASGVGVRVNEFLSRASALALHLPQKAWAINMSSDRYEFLLGFCAAIIAGQCTLMPPNRQRNTIRQVADEYSDSYILGGDPVEGFPHCAITEYRDGEPLSDIPDVPDEQICAIVFTSGSTGESQPNRKSWRTLRLGAVSNAGLICEATSRETLSLAATVPPQHMWGFETTILLPLFARVAVSAQTPFFPRDIVEVMRGMPRPRGLVSSPVHLNAFLAADAGEVVIDRIYSATAPMPADTARQLEDTFGARFIEIFGCSESGIIAARRTSSEGDWRLAEAFCLRSAGRHTEILAGHLDEAVRLNDRVELLDSHRFRWLGRDDDMINVAGKRGSLGDINLRLNGLQGVSDAIVFLPDGGAGRLAALVVAPSLQPSDILAGLRESIDPAFLPRPVYIVPALPRQETGKLPRGKVLEMFNELRRQHRSGAKDDDEIPTAS